MAQGRRLWLVLLAAGCGDAALSSERWPTVTPRCRPARLRPDFNGDGIGDLAVRAGEELYVYLGARGVPSSAPAVTVPTSGRLLYAGDVNGDGFGDLVVYRLATHEVEPPRPAEGGWVRVFLGSARGIDPASRVELEPPADVQVAFPFRPLPARDVNGDGYDDLIVGLFARHGTVVFLGSAQGITRTAARTLETTLAHGLGDFNQDGFDDAVSSLRIHWGSRDGLSDDRAVRVDPLGNDVDSAGDVNGDLCPDVMYRRIVSETLPLFVVPGGSDRIEPIRWTPRLPSGVEAVLLNGRSFADGVRDVDGDGFDDILLSGHCLTPSTPCPDRAPFERYLLRGHPDAVPLPVAEEAPDVVPVSGSSEGWVFVGDLNGDGRDEFALPSSSSQLRIYTGLPTSASAHPLLTLQLASSVWWVQGSLF